MEVPRPYLPNYNGLANRLADLGDRYQANKQRQSLGAALPAAYAGDQNALAQLAQLDPNAYGQVQSELFQRDRLKTSDAASAAAAERERKLQALKWGAGAIIGAQTPEEKARIYSMQVRPHLEGLGFAGLPEQYDPSVDATANSILQRFPEMPKAQTPTDDMREYELAQQQGYGGNFVDYLTGLKKAGASSTTVSYGSPVAGTDEQGNPVYFQPSNKGGAPQILPGVKPPPNKSEQPTQDERQSALLLQRLRRAQNDMAGVLKTAPGAARPEISGAIVGAVAGDTARNFANSEERQRIEAAQDDALDAALTLATGAAYTKEQLAMQRRSHFPQIGDSPATAAEKNKRFADLVKDAELRAGRATPPSASPAKAPPAVGTVRNGYVYKGGDPASPSSWAKQ